MATPEIVQAAAVSASGQQQRAGIVGIAGLVSAFGSIVIEMAGRRNEAQRVACPWNGPSIVGGAADGVDVEHDHLPRLQLDGDCRAIVALFPGEAAADDHVLAVLEDVLADALRSVRAQDPVRRQPFRAVLFVAAIHTLVVASGLIGQTWPSRWPALRRPSSLSGTDTVT